MITEITKYPEQRELFNRVLTVAQDYADVISLAAVCGILDMVKDELKLPEDLS